ncbi:hypothetical protein P9112_010837 [Eukaryota sp. TZLM1-RC]
MIVGACTECSDAERKIITHLMMKGFAAACHELNVRLSGGHTILNPEFLIGGTVVGLSPDDKLVRPTGAREGDVLILTKPLGTQIISNVAQWLEHAFLQRKGYGHVSPHCIKKWKQLVDVFGEEKLAQEVKASRTKANQSMARMNNIAANVMLKYNAHCCSDVTGFGILGHAQNLAELALTCVDFLIDLLPCWSAAVLVNTQVDFGLLRGTSPETSGGLLFAVDPSVQEEVLKELHGNGDYGFVVGKVVEGNGIAKVVDTAEVLKVDF